MTTKKLTELYGVYQEIFDRIKRHIDRFAYATYSYPCLDYWIFDDAHTIVIYTSDSYFDDYTGYDETYIPVESKYLETDKAFEDWINVKYKEREAEDARKAKLEAKRKDDYERSIYEKLKNKFE